MDPAGLSSRADQGLDTTRSWAVTHDQVMVFGSAASRTGHETWLDGSDMHGPRSARRRRSLLGIGQIAPTGASVGRHHPAPLQGQRRVQSAAPWMPAVTSDLDVPAFRRHSDEPDGARSTHSVGAAGAEPASSVGPRGPNVRPQATRRDRTPLPRWPPGALPKRGRSLGRAARREPRALAATTPRLAELDAVAPARPSDRTPSRPAPAALLADLVEPAKYIALEKTRPG